jgi:hypothetical protein
VLSGAYKNATYFAAKADDFAGSTTSTESMPGKRFFLQWRQSDGIRGRGPEGWR